MRTAMELLAPPAKHASYGAAGTLGMVLVLTNIMQNGKALLHALQRFDFSKLRFIKPTRSITAVAVFVGIFRFIERLESIRKNKTELLTDHETKTQNPKDMPIRSPMSASVLASILGILCVAPQNRSAIVSLVSINALSVWFRELIEKHPELAHLSSLELAAFMACSGWIMFSAFFHPESYEVSHMKLIMRYTLISPKGAFEIQDQYRRGLNPNTCGIRHVGQGCNEFLFRRFIGQVVAKGLQVYLPVHFTTWLLSLRHPKARATPFHQLLRTFTEKVVRSSMYFIVYIAVGWTMNCYTQSIGDKSLTLRKLQYLICGSLPAAAILFESPARRRPIGVILASYAAISMGSVAAQRFQWLRQGSGTIRTVLDIACVTAAIAYTMPGTLVSNGMLKHVLIGSNNVRSTKRKSTDRNIRKSELQ